MRTFKTHSALWACASHTLQKYDAFRGLFEKLGIARNVDELTHKNEATPQILASSRNQLLKIATNYHSVVLIIPSRGLWHGSNIPVEQQVHEQFVQSLREAGLPIIDMKPIFEKTGNPLGFYFKHDPHWSPKGHAAATEALYEHLSRAEDWKFLRASRPADRPR